MSKTTSLVVPCAHFQWRLFTRKGVYYADCRKDGLGKHSLGTRDYKVAMEKIRELDQIAWNSSSPQVRVSELVAKKSGYSKVGIDDGWSIYLDDHSEPDHQGGLKESSVRKYNTHRKRFVAYCEHRGIDCWSRVDEFLLKKYSKLLDKKLAPITIHDDLTMEISVSNHLIETSLLPPENKIRWDRPAPPYSEQYCYEIDEVDRMLAFCKNFKRNHWLYPAILLLSRTGVRISEAINLEWPDIDFKDELIHIKNDTNKKVTTGRRRTTKSGKSRLIPIDHELLELLLDRRKKSGPVLLGDRGSRLNYNHARDTFVKKIIEPLDVEFPTLEDQLGFRDGRFHSFRHFFISQCFDCEISETLIKDWVGHSNSKVVNLYRHKKSKTSKLKMKQVVFGAT